MSTSGVVIIRMASAAGLLPSTVNRIVRDLRANGMAPMGKHGRGQEHGQFEAIHLANIILGFAASLPSGSAEAAKALAQLYAENLQGDFKAGDFAESLGANLVDEINARARLILSKQIERLEENEVKWELTLCLNPVMAWENWIKDGIDQHRYYRMLGQINLPKMPHPQESNSGIRKLTVITVQVLNAAAALCADALSREPSPKTE